MRSVPLASFRPGFSIFIGAAFLLAQLGMVVYARTTQERYFCWAPNDYVVNYQLNVEIGGRQLSADEAAQRYHLTWGPNANHIYENPAVHLIGIVRQYETTYGRNDHAQVVLRWRLNGHPEEQQWRWPEDHL